MFTLPPLSLYIHFPWCLSKCPYCDFNSHAVRNLFPERDYIKALLKDLDHDLAYVQGRCIQSIFMGGGTPSLFLPGSIHYLLERVAHRVAFSETIEITLEANPGAVEYQRFTGYRAAGINRISLGVQSFQRQKLKILGRIHNEVEAKEAILAAQSAGFTNINIDLMYNLPEQTLADGLEDLTTALQLNPTHLSWYQLTLEPHTAFYRNPPKQPLEDLVCNLQERGENLCSTARYKHYEISSYSHAGYSCLHNRNYWEFGDYLGIGAGAHSKITFSKDFGIIRSWKFKNPREYLNKKDSFSAEKKWISSKELPFEFMLNVLRLYQPIPIELFYSRTRLPFSSIRASLEKAQEKGLLRYNETFIETTELGRRFYNDLVALFI